MPCQNCIVDDARFPSLQGRPLIGSLFWKWRFPVFEGQGSGSYGVEQHQTSTIAYIRHNALAVNYINKNTAPRRQCMQECWVPHPAHPRTCVNAPQACALYWKISSGGAAGRQEAGFRPLKTSDIGIDGTGRSIGPAVQADGAASALNNTLNETLYPVIAAERPRTASKILYIEDGQTYCSIMKSGSQVLSSSEASGNSSSSAGAGAAPQSSSSHHGLKAEPKPSAAIASVQSPSTAVSNASASPAAAPDRAVAASSNANSTCVPPPDTVVRLLNDVIGGRVQVFPSEAACCRPGSGAYQEGCYTWRL